jgi:glutamyl-tRNA synthetase
VQQVVVAAGDRIKTAGDILECSEFFVADDALPYDEKAVAKRLQKGRGAELLQAFRDPLSRVEPFDAANTEQALRDFVDSQGIKIGDIIHALRVAVTGKSVGLGMFEALEILGRDTALARIDQTLARL